MAHIENTSYELKTTDVMGFKLPFKRFEGIDYAFWTFLPDNIKEHLEDIKNVKIRDDDVLGCTYPRSGTNWTNEIVRMLLEGSHKYTDFFLEHLDHKPKDKLEEMQSPRILISHFPFCYLPRQFAKKGRIIYVFRNPKDVAVSFHQLLGKVKFADYNGNLDDFLKLFYNGDLPGGSWFSHILGWEKVIADKSANELLPLYFEDMKKDLRTEVDKIADFLGVPFNEELFANITTQCEFTNLNKEKTTNMPEVVANFTRDKSNCLYWKGEVGGWKNWFTVAQNEEFDSIYKTRMKNSKLSFTYEI